MKDKITEQQYLDFQAAFDFFNAQLFADSLPQVLVTLQRHAKARGYFAPNASTGAGTKSPSMRLRSTPIASVMRQTSAFFRRLLTRWLICGSKPTAARRAAAITTVSGPGR